MHQVNLLRSWKGPLTLHCASLFSWSFQAPLSTSKNESPGAEDERGRVCGSLGKAVCRTHLIGSLFFQLEMKARAEPGVLLLLLPSNTAVPRDAVPRATWLWGLTWPTPPSPLIFLHSLNYQTSKKLSYKVRKKKFVFAGGLLKHKALGTDPFAWFSERRRLHPSLQSAALSQHAGPRLVPCPSPPPRNH